VISAGGFKGLRRRQVKFVVGSGGRSSRQGRIGRIKKLNYSGVGICLFIEQGGIKVWEVDKRSSGGPGLAFDEAKVE